MAAGTRTGGGNRLFLQTCKDKNGKPYFGRYLKEVPNPVPEGVVLDTTISKAGKITNFQRFIRPSGVLKTIFTEVEEIVGKKVKKLNVILADGEHTYQIDLGSVSGSYARQFLQRVISPAVNINKEIGLEVYSFTKEDKTLGTSLSFKQDEKSINLKDNEGNYQEFIKAMPPGVKKEVNDDIVTDYKDQLAWLFGAAIKALPPSIFEKKAPATESTTPTAAVPTPIATPVEAPPIVVNVPTATAPPLEPTPTPVDNDDLPF